MNYSGFLLDHHLAQTTMYPFALEIDHAEGLYITCTDGKKYIDLISGIGVSHLGHSNPHIVHAITEQLKKHMHVMVYGEFIQSTQVRAASLLTSLLPSSLDICYFVNSGTEANEAALKLAKRITGRPGIVSFKGAYHGNTHGSMSVSSNETKKAAFRPLLPAVQFIRLNEEKDLELIDEKTACVILETIQGDAGVRIPTANYLNALRKKCDETGTLLVFDEIQCGMGRTGKMFAFEHYGIVPDILTLGKALGGGMPVGCMVSSKNNMQQFTHNPMLGHISTFAGHPVICAAVEAFLQVMLEEKTVDHVEEKGKMFESLLQHPRIKTIRRIGLFFAIEMENEEIVQQVVQKCLDHGLISFWFLSCPDSFRIAPPLNISEDEIKLSCDIILKSLDEINIALKNG